MIIITTILNSGTKPLKKYQELFNSNNFQLQNTLLFNFIQNESIIIEREFGETIFNDFMKEEQTFIHTCNEIIDIKCKKKFTWKMIKNIWTKVELETIKINNKTENTTREKPPRNKEHRGAEGPSSLPEPKTKNKQKEVLIEHEHIYERNKLLKYNTSALTQNIDPSYNIINTQNRNTLIKFAREQIATNPLHKLTYQKLLLNISTNHGAKAKYQQYKNISVATRKKNKSDRRAPSREGGDLGAPVTGTLRRHAEEATPFLPSTDPDSILLTPLDRCAGDPSALTGAKGGDPGPGRGDPSTTGTSGEPAQNTTTPYRESSLYPTQHRENTTTQANTHKQPHTHTTRNDTTEKQHQQQQTQTTSTTATNTKTTETTATATTHTHTNRKDTSRIKTDYH